MLAPYGSLRNRQACQRTVAGTHDDIPAGHRGYPVREKLNSVPGIGGKGIFRRFAQFLAVGYGPPQRNSLNVTPQGTCTSSEGPVGRLTGYNFHKMNQCGAQRILC